MPVSESIRIVTTQGSNVLDSTAYISGDTSIYVQVPIFGSGLQSGTLCSIVQSGLCALSFTNNLPSGMLNVTFGCKSGTVTFNQNAGTQTAWYSGNSFTNPIAICSGDVSYLAFQNVSGYGTSASGIYSVTLQVLSNN